MRYTVAIYPNGTRALELVLADKVVVKNDGTVLFYDEEHTQEGGDSTCVAAFQTPWSIIGYESET